MKALSAFFPVTGPAGMRRSPILRAMAWQCAAVLPAFLVLLGAARIFNVSIAPMHAALVLGVFAALLSRKRLAPWWIAIQFALPPALVLSLSFDIPPGWFLAVFLLMLGVYWSTFRTQVPYYPSGHAVRDVVASLLPDRPHAFIDIGSGLGELPLDLAQRRPDSQYAGIEIAPLPWLVSRVRACFVREGRACRFYRGDYHRLDLADYDVVFAYLSPAAMPALWKKVEREMRPGSLFLSYEFVVPGVEPGIRIEAERDGRVLYGWRM